MFAAMPHPEFATMPTPDYAFGDSSSQLAAMASAGLAQEGFDSAVATQMLYASLCDYTSNQTIQFENDDQSELGLLSLGDSDEDVDYSNMSKNEIRKHKNRQSAARSRQRTRERMEQLEDLVMQLTATNQELERQVQLMVLQQFGAPNVQSVPAYAPFH